MDERKGKEEKRRLERRKKLIRRRRIAVSGMALVLILLIVGATSLLRSCVNKEEQGAEDQNTSDTNAEGTLDQDTETEQIQGLVIEVEEVETLPVSFTVSLVGDCTLGTDESYGTSGTFVEEYSLQYPSYFLENVSGVFESDDLTIVNLEGPLTDSTNKQDKTFAFKGDGSYTEILTSGSVEVVNLANNHSYDYGTEGFEDTQENVEAAGITWFGYDETPVMEVNGVKVGLVGVYMLRLTDEEGKEAIASRIQQVEEAGAEVVIVSFHWGVEGSYTPTESQEMLAKYAIDEGADLVVGHHPHVLQGIDEYNGKYIVYSLGNFCFGGNRNPSDKDTIIFQQTFTVQNSEVVIDDNINIIPCSISSTSSRNNYQPTILTGDSKDRVAEKLQEISMIDIMDYIAL